MVCSSGSNFAPLPLRGADEADGGDVHVREAADVTTSFLSKLSVFRPRMPRWRTGGMPWRMPTCSASSWSPITLPRIEVHAPGFEQFLEVRGLVAARRIHHLALRHHHLLLLGGRVLLGDRVHEGDDVAAAQRELVDGELRGERQSPSGCTMTSTSTSA